MTRINSYPHDGKEIDLVFKGDVAAEENCFTVIIGKNGIGKSRFLCNITKYLSRLSGEGVSYDKRVTSQLEMGGGYLIKHNVIAVSTSPFDRFPNARRRTVDGSLENYRYVGMRGEGPYGMSSSVALISSAAKGLLEKFKKGNSSENLIQVFNTLGFASNVMLMFKPSYIGKESVQNSSVLSQDSSVYLDLLCHEKDYNIFISEKFREPLGLLSMPKRHKVLAAIRLLHKTLPVNKAIGMEIDFSMQRCSLEGVAANEEVLDALSTLMSHGFIRIMDMYLEKLTHGLMSLKRASSGEQCLLVIMLGIAGHINHDSVVLIDEPEVSLHPQWQEEFMTLLMSAFSNYKGCQFIIATHSPQLISRLKDRVCFITSLSQKRTYRSSEFMQRSADYQLAELFDAPGTMNEYISRLAFNLLAQVKSAKGLDNELLDDLERLKNLNEKIEEEDPLKELVVSVIEACAYYANN